MVSLYFLISPYPVCLLCLIAFLPHHALSLPPSDSRLVVNFVIRCLENADIPNEDAQSIQRIFPEPPWLDPSSLNTQSCPGVIEYFITNLRALLSETGSATGTSLADREDNMAALREDDTGDKHSRFALKRSPERSLDRKEIVRLWNFINDLLRSSRRQPRRAAYRKMRPGVGVEWETGKSESQNVNIRIRPTRGMPGVGQPEPGSPVKEFDPMLSSDDHRRGERIPELKRGYGSWYDVMRFAVSKRSQNVLSINNAMVALSDLMMEQYRNRVLKNREKMRYNMLLQG